MSAISGLEISVQKQPFSDSALLLLQSLSFGANLCCPATTVAEFFSCTREKFCSSATTGAECFSPEKYSALLLPELQNVSHREMFCSSATTIAECFSSEKYSALLFPEQQNVSHQWQKFCSLAPTEIFCSSGATVAEFFS